jgi:hypothetical protein
VLTRAKPSEPITSVFTQVPNNGCPHSGQSSLTLRGRTVPLINTNRSEVCSCRSMYIRELRPVQSLMTGRMIVSSIAEAIARGTFHATSLHYLLPLYTQPHQGHATSICTSIPSLKKLSRQAALNITSPHYQTNYMELSTTREIPSCLDTR